MLIHKGRPRMVRKFVASSSILDINYICDLLEIRKATHEERNISCF